MPGLSRVMPAPWLILAVGNPSRGDDALGPELVARMSLAEDSAPDIEFLVDFQLQVEHALDLKGRLAVLFVDAARPGVISEQRALDTNVRAADSEETVGVAVLPIVADEFVPPASHALRAEAVLHIARQLDGEVPPAWQLAIEGQSFALGDGLSELAEQHLKQAIDLAQSWLDARRASAA